MDYASLLPFIDELRGLAAPLLGIPLTDQPRVALVAQAQQYTSSAEELVTVEVGDLMEMFLQISAMIWVWINTY